MKGNILSSTKRTQNNVMRRDIWENYYGYLFAATSQISQSSQKLAMTIRAFARRHLTFLLITLLFVGFNQRTVLLEVPPISPLIQHSLNLNYTEIGFLVSLPILIFGIFAYPSVAIIDRLGYWGAITLALCIMAVTSFLRMFSSTGIVLFLLTILLSMGVAICQTSIPLLVRERFPLSIGQVTAAFTTFLMLGEIAASSLTTPFIMRTLAQNNWRGTFIAWSIPVWITLAMWLYAAKRNRKRSSQHAQESTQSVPAAHAPSVPTLKSWFGWQISLLPGCSSLIFFGMDTWIPIYFARLHRADSTLALAILTIAQLIPGFLLILFGDRLAGRPIGFLLPGMLASIAMIFWFIGPPSWYLIIIGLMGGTSAMIFILSLALPPVLGDNHSVTQIAGMVLFIGYISAFIGPFIGGVLLDISHISIIPFVPVALAGFGTVAVAISLALGKHFAADMTNLSFREKLWSKISL